MRARLVLERGDEVQRHDGGGGRRHLIIIFFFWLFLRWPLWNWVLVVVFVGRAAKPAKEAAKTEEQAKKAPKAAAKPAAIPPKKVEPPQANETKSIGHFMSNITQIPCAPTSVTKRSSQRVIRHAKTWGVFIFFRDASLTVLRNVVVEAAVLGQARPWLGQARPWEV